MSELATQSCRPAKHGTDALPETEIPILLSQLDHWERNNNTVIQRCFKFGNFQQTMAFVNQVASIAEQQDHHPEIYLTYNTCQVMYTTHSVNSLTRNDFICAAKIDQLLQDPDSWKLR